MKIYTRTGDDGTTGLFGGPRVPKNDARIDAYGTVDEMNAAIGLARAHLPAESRGLDEVLAEIQGELMILGADLATPPAADVRVPRMEAAHSQALESRIDGLDRKLPPLTKFILPTGTPAAASLHLARTICRRAERQVAGLVAEETAGRNTLVFLNRLSDFLFVAARFANLDAGREEVTWSGL